MSPIWNFTLTYEALNEEGTFSEGDALCGTVTFTLTKDTKVKNVVKAKGDVDVHWKGEGASSTAHRRYFTVKEYVLGEDGQGTVLPKGHHNFRFTLQIPDGDMPSSFTGLHGKIVYMLEAKLSRSWRSLSTVQKEIKFVSKSILQPEKLRRLQSTSVTKKTGFLFIGKVQMSATVSRRYCSPVFYCFIIHELTQVMCYEVFPWERAHIQMLRFDTTNSAKTTLNKVVGETLKQNSEETVSCQIMIPRDATYTLKNCDIISVDYFLKVNLDIPFAIGPVAMFPLVVIPSSLAALQPDGALGPHPAGAVGAPAAPRLFQHGEEPPSYMSLFPTSQDNQQQQGTKV
ncbi:hypothetical protein Q5P01_015231 [Channa striata]|uniref:Arrestin C-terminal-like domain-containing protein n=1 Tax=Channa striata TaxID=64152 RepID=A0AA88MI40_CHASR|nr:hypothetical protein Q5P01_015231 [Channa striata]